MEAPRIVSLLPAATETLFALGLGPRIVGRSHECDYPLEAKQISICSRSKIPANPGESASIHNDIKTMLSQALAIYEVDLEVLRQLQPTHIVTQHQCGVCAVSLEDVQSALGNWLGRTPAIISLAPQNLDDIFEDILKVGQQLSAVFPAEDLVGRCLRRMNQLIARGRDMRHKPSIACIEWTEPLMAAGYWVPQLVAGAGGRALFAKPGEHSPPLSMATLSASDPDLIVAMPCGFSLDEARQAVVQLGRLPDWQKLRAVRQGNVFITDGQQFFNRPGPRMVESLEILAEIFHPQVFQFGHHGKGWQRFFN